MQRRLSMITIAVLAAVIAGLAAVLLYGQAFDRSEGGAVRVADVARVQALTERRAPFADFTALFTEIAEKKGGVYAFNLMRVAPFPFGLDQHLLGHTVGDILYQQKGIDGMALCTQDFRNACSHTMVIGALLEYGEGVLPRIREACHLAPGGSGAYTMCFHGLGHGVLAYNLYDMEKTAVMCRKFGTAAYQDREAVECFGGAIMEIIGGGGHDRAYWETRRQEYLDPADPFGFCERAIVPDEFRSICYTYMTPFAFEAVGADMADPGPEAFKKSFVFCDQVPAGERAEREACFGGFGKEFIGLATGRDLVLADGPTETQLATMRDWCMLARPADGRTDCLTAVADSLYWGGEKPFDPVLAFCSMVDAAFAAACYNTSMRNVAQYVADPRYRATYCAALPETYQEQCRMMLMPNGNNT